ncbi:MAG: hypothetical protein IJ679_06790, partial [Lachnospiraceae bacterium]|nr:hypothetical protein [Lachnospiraceae bacterium]
STVEYPDGFARDVQQNKVPVFSADDGTLYGIIDRLDENGKKIIWGGEPICKITDPDGNLLYFKADKNSSTLLPAVFDQLDNGSTSPDKTGAFSLLKHKQEDLRDLMFQSNGDPYDVKTVFHVKMLQETYEASKYITTNQANASWEKIILTTAGSNDTDGYPYRGRAGTYATIVRGDKVPSENKLFTTKVNITLTNITLDGNRKRTTKDNGCIVLLKDSNYAKLTLGQGAILQNGINAEKGGAVALQTGSIEIRGGTIRDCISEKDGGAICMEEINNKQNKITLLLDAGDLYRCTANGNGGAIAVNNGTFTMSGGTIDQCKAQKGGGVFVANDRIFRMSGGNIVGNSATEEGGGIAVGNIGSRLYFSKKPTVTGNQRGDDLCNVELKLDSNVIINTTGGGLYNGARIGVFVPDGNASKHGEKGLPFGTYTTGDDTSTLYGFINDRNGLKGGLIEGGTANTIYWIEIFSLEVKNTVKTSGQIPEDRINKTKDLSFRYRVILRGNSSSDGKSISTILAENGNQFGEMVFESTTDGAAVAEFSLKDGETITGEKLPPGLEYEVIELDYKEAVESDYEIVEREMDGREVDFVAIPKNSRKRIIEELKKLNNNRQGIIGENASDSVPKNKWYTSQLHFENLLPVCKVTNKNGYLLYRECQYTVDGENKSFKIPAVYTELSEAFDDNSLYASYSGSSFSKDNGYQVKMLTETYILDENKDETKAPLIAKHDIDFVTAGDSEHLFPYYGIDSDKTSTIYRGYQGASMIWVENHTLTIDKLILHGRKNNHLATADGGIIEVKNNGTLTLKQNAVLQNAQTTQNGGAIYNAGTVHLNNTTIKNNKANLKGGAIYNTGTIHMTNSAIQKNESEEKGGGIYLAQNSKLTLSSEPDFGGPGMKFHGIDSEVGNHQIGELNSENGGSYYGKARQDIYIAESGDAPASLILKGNLSGEKGSIWVWAEHANHYEKTKPFAKIDSSDTLSKNGYALFRNAVPDEKTGCGGDTYLTGTSGTNKQYVYWTDGLNGYDVSFKKVDGFGNPLSGAAFGLFTDPACTQAFQQEGQDLTAISSGGTPANAGSGETSTAGTVLFAQVPTGVYYMKETTVPTGYVNSIQAGNSVSTPVSNTYIVLVGDALNSASLPDELQKQIQTGTDDPKKNFAVFLIDASAYTATPDTSVAIVTVPKVIADGKTIQITPDIAKYGILNCAAKTKKVFLNKTDSSGKPIPINKDEDKAKFEILRYDRTPVWTIDSTGKITATYETDDSGIFYVGDLPYGTYYVREKQVPKGYQSLSEDGNWFTMTINEESNTNATMQLNPVESID